ncbi:MAG: hypothetical protein IJS71_08550 [Clostridia bacterium]|nr:hypothetical protein [Clostridia bacterium]
MKGKARTMESKINIGILAGGIQDDTKEEIQNAAEGKDNDSPLGSVRNNRSDHDDGVRPDNTGDGGGQEDG